MESLLTCFLAAAIEDPRITVVHISLYLALLHHWQMRGAHDPLQVFSWEIMPWCKISGTATYHRCIQELNTYGYIQYSPSYNHYRGSRVYLAILKNKYYLNTMKNDMQSQDKILLKKQS